MATKLKIELCDSQHHGWRLCQGVWRQVVKGHEERSGDGMGYCAGSPLKCGVEGANT